MVRWAFRTTSTKNISASRNGFTIVELLIVIVVIAILAAITIVSYNGIQNRAKNQQVTSAVRTYYAALTNYATDNNGALPASRTCLGASSFYTSNPCYIGGATYNWGETLNTSLSPYVKTAPTLPAGTVTGSGITASGIFYDNSSGKGGDGYIGFPVFGSSSCPSIAGALPYSQTTTGQDMYCRIYTPAT